MNIHFILLAIFVLVVAVAAILVAMVKNGFWKCLLFSVAGGVGSLFLLHFTSLITGIAVSVNWYSIALSCLGGIPSVVGMVVLKLI